MVRIFSIFFWVFFLYVSVGATKPNVIFFAVDDMNDWIGPMGSKVATTPNLDRLAKKGVTFTNAHTAGVYCAPSRSAIFTGRYASTSGCYSNQVYFYNHPEYRPLQVAFQEGGYNTFGAGKLFHHPKGAIDRRGWTEFFIRTKDQKQNGWGMDTWDHGAPLPTPYPHSKFNQANPKWKGKPFMEVGPVPNESEDDIVDTRRTNWACDILNKKHDKPFFLALGLYAPHYPNYAPQKYFDMYPLDKIQRGAWKENDLDDLPASVKKKHTARKKAIHDKLEKMNIIDSTIQGYLACISFADANLGRVLDALEKSDYKDNTIIVFWSDHGYAQGEKGHWGKHTLWQRTSNVPFIWAGPGVAQGKKTDFTSTLIDMYPTFADMCGLPKDKEHDGLVLTDVLKDPSTAFERSVLLPYDTAGSYAIINKKWRYIAYKDGGEELYNVEKDNNEWYNLAANPAYDKVKAEMKSHAPEKFAKEGLSQSKLKLVIEGENYHWEKK